MRSGRLDRSYLEEAVGLDQPISCADCHISHEIVPKLIRKAEAVREIYHHVLGTIDTPEGSASNHASLENPK